MSKSILLMNTPNTCGECQLLYYCYKYADHINMDTKPDWCPLEKLPDRQLIWYEDEASDFERGFNACLDEICKQ